MLPDSLGQKNLFGYEHPFGTHRLPRTPTCGEDEKLFPARRKILLHYAKEAEQCQCLFAPWGRTHSPA
jgi:hypothetical protein